MRSISSLVPAYFASLFAVSLTLTAGATAQEAPPSTFAETVDVEVVQIDVHVTDKKGRPITDLERGDFVLTVDGKPVEITNFRAVAGPADAGGAMASPGLEPLEPVTTPAAETAADPLSIVLFFDTLHLEPAGRRRVIEQISDFVERQTAAGHRVMLIEHHQGTRVLEPFTRDAATIEARLDELGETVPAGLFRRREWLAVLEDIRTILTGCPGGGDPCRECQYELSGAARQHADLAGASRHRVENGLANAIALLSRVGGRKALILVSDGFAMRPGAEAFHYLAELCPQIASRFLAETTKSAGPGELQRLVERANANRVTVYSLEAKGLEGDSASSVDFLDFRFRPSLMNDRVRRANTQNTLFFLAEETGGTAVFDSNQPGPELLDLAEDFDHYYSLGYMPDHAAEEGHRHRVGVSLERKQLKVRYRRAFRHKPLGEQLAERTLGALMLGLTENALGATVVAGAPRPQEGGKLLLPFEISIPSGRLETVPGAIEEGQLILVVAAPDDDGEGLSVRKREVVVRTAAGEDHRFGVEVTLDPGDHRLAFGLRDRLGGRTSFLHLDVSTAGVGGGEGAESVSF